MHLTTLHPNPTQSTQWSLGMGMCVEFRGTRYNPLLGNVGSKLGLADSIHAKEAGR